MPCCCNSYACLCAKCICGHTRPAQACVCQRECCSVTRPAVTAIRHASLATGQPGHRRSFDKIATGVQLHCSSTCSCKVFQCAAPCSSTAPGPICCSPCCCTHTFTQCASPSCSLCCVVGLCRAVLCCTTLCCDVLCCAGRMETTQRSTSASAGTPSPWATLLTTLPPTTQVTAPAAQCGRLQRGTQTGSGLLLMLLST